MMPRARAHVDACAASRGPVVAGAGGVAGIVAPEHQRAGGVALVDPGEVEVPVVVEGHRDRAQAGEQRTHRVGRVGSRGIEHGVARRVAQRQRARQRRDQLLGADAGDDLSARQHAAEAALDPARGRGR